MRVLNTILSSEIVLRRIYNQICSSIAEAPGVRTPPKDYNNNFACSKPHQKTQPPHYFIKEEYNE